MTEDHAALTPYAVEFSDGYYSVRQAFSDKHAGDLSRERHPGKTIKSIRCLVPLTKQETKRCGF